MIVGLGLDLVELPRIKRSLERFGSRFVHKLLHDSEAALMPHGADMASPALVTHIASRFAAKEAGSKALGSGFSEGIGLHDIRIHSLPSGKPEILFFGKARERAERMQVDRAHLSITHTNDNACAVVVLEAVLRESV